jgi:5-methylcytosine-specific restriction protein A
MGQHQAPWSSWYGTERWRRRSILQLREHPLCAMCLKRGRVTPAKVADHIVPHNGDRNAFLIGALQSLCKSCHDSDKRIVEIRGYSPEIGPDGWPTDPSHPAYRATTKRE